MIVINDNGTSGTGIIEARTYTVTATDATAGKITLTFGNLPNVKVYATQVLRSGKKVADDSTYTVSGKELTITENATTPTWDITAGDIVMVFAGGGN